MKKSKFIIILILFYSCVNFGQACGGGIYSFQFLSSEYKILPNLKYEFLTIRKEVLHDSVFKKAHLGIPLGEDEVKALVNDSPSLSEVSVILKCLKRSNLDSVGTHSSNFKFHTLELLNHPLILKIKSNDKSFYFLDNFFGGCNRENFFVLDKKNLTIKSDINYDGHSDFINLTGVEQHGESSFDVYLYNSHKKTYKYSKEFSKSSNEKSNTFYEDLNISHIENEIYRLHKSHYLIIQKYVDGNGNNYYDNIRLSLISFSNHKIRYHPFTLKNEGLFSLTDDNKSIKISQHQGFNYEDDMFVKYDESSRVLEFQFTSFYALSEDNLGDFISFKYKFEDGKFNLISKESKKVPVK